MGTWGVGIYSNDTAEEVRDICNEIYPFVSVEEGNKIIFKEFEELLKTNLIDNDYASFWYALSDWQWKHGILSEDIRAKTMELLEINAGIEEWKESGGQVNSKKRITIMEKLKSQLNSPMPACTIAPVKLVKPKHKIGDIIIFRSCARNEDYYDNLWEIKNICPPLIFRDEQLSQSGDKIHPPFDAHEKYMAILCVGTKKIQHSSYLPDVFDEYSIYAYYDYISPRKPSLSELSSRGFLPMVFWNYKECEDMVDYIGWTYTFNLLTETFRVSKNSAIKEVNKIRSCSESERFYYMSDKKKYLTETQREFDLYHAFADFWEEKTRMNRLGITIDTLIREDIINPELLPLEDIDFV